MIVKEIATYADTLVTGLMRVDVERDESNLPLENDATPVMP